MRINFLNDGYRNCGGCLQIVKYANLLADMGHETFLTYTHSFSFDLVEVKSSLVYSPLLRDDEVPDCDAVISSSWFMAGKVAGLPGSKGTKFAYLQDFENWSGSSEEIIGNWRQPVHLVAVARYLEDAAMHHVSKRAQRIPYGIDFDLFNPGDRRMPGPQGITVGGLYNAMPRKRFDDLAAVVENLRSRGVPAKLSLFGAVPRPDCIPDHADYLEAPTREELAAMMRGCHVWLAMSEQEGLHIPPMEAMACGAVPVCTDIGGMRDYCLDGETGFRVEVGDVPGAADRIKELHTDPDLWGRMVTNSLDHIRAMGSERENAARLAELFASRSGEAGMRALFDFTADNHNTHATLAAYLACAESHLDRGDKDYARQLVEPVIDYYETMAVNADHPGVLSRHEDAYGMALEMRNRITGETRQGFSQRAFRYGPTRPGVVEALAGAKGRELTATYANKARFDGKLRIYLTLACNLSCPYCVNEKTRGIVRARKPATAKAWAEAINREGRHVVFTGGEPFLFKDLPGLINAVDPFLSISVYTNLSRDVVDQLAAIEREVRFYVSWHAHQEPDRDVFLNNAKTILANPRFTLTAHAIEAHENQRSLAGDLEFFRENGLPIEVDVDQRDFEGCLKNATGDAICRKRIYLVDPEGDRYQCVSRLMRRNRPMENIFKNPLQEDICVDDCPDYGICAPCDGLGETCMGVLGPGRLTK